MVGEQWVVRSLLWSGPTFIAGYYSGLPWLAILGCLMLLPFAVVGLAGFVWFLIDQLR
jgi:hypothetical protein